MKTDSVRIQEPQTKEQFEAYFLVRYQTLREPWSQPPGSERDEQENTADHAMACDEKNHVLGVCRLQLNSPDEAQLRYMGVKTETLGLGIGKKLIAYMENKARQKGASRMILQARENAVEFYKKCGYTVVEKSYLMWEQIQHYLMEKKL